MSVSPSQSASASPSAADYWDGIPRIMLQYSDDGGHTWSEELWMSAGEEGQYAWRAVWRRLGKSRDRVWRVAMSDPVPWQLLDAYVQLGKGMS